MNGSWIATTAAATCVAVAGCGPRADDGNRVPAPGDAREPDVVYSSGWTAGIIDRRRTGAPVATLVDVRSARHADFDRVVFEYDRLPGLHTEYIDRPVRQCGSGNVVRIAGDGWLEVRMQPARAHTDEGEPTIADRERMPNLPLLSELELTCDFEADVTWVLGVESPNRYRVLELRSPPRVVVDVRH